MAERINWTNYYNQAVNGQRPTISADIQAARQAAVNAWANVNTHINAHPRAAAIRDVGVGAAQNWWENVRPDQLLNHNRYWYLGCGIGFTETIALHALAPIPGVGGAAKGVVNWVVLQGLGMTADVIHESRRNRVISSSMNLAEQTARLAELENVNANWKTQLEQVTKGIAAGSTYGSLGISIDHILGNPVGKIGSAVAQGVGSFVSGERTPIPTQIPTKVPTGIPTEVRASVPTQVPTAVPTETRVPFTATPVATPTEVTLIVEPNDTPTAVATSTPTAQPTGVPTQTPIAETRVPSTATATVVPTETRVLVTSTPVASPTEVPATATPVDAQPTPTAPAAPSAPIAAAPQPAPIITERGGGFVQIGPKFPPDGALDIHPNVPGVDTGVAPSASVPGVGAAQAAAEAAQAQAQAHAEAAVAGKAASVTQLMTELQNNSDLVTEHVVARGETAGHLVLAMGGNLNWDGTDWQAFAALRALNPEAFADIQTAAGLSDSQFEELVDRMSKGDKAAYDKFIKHMSLIRAGTKIRMLTPDGLHKLSALGKVIPFRPRAVIPGLDLAA